MYGQTPDTIKILLEEKAGIYNCPAFIEDDPVQIPHLFSDRENIEISGFLAAMLAWGRRDIIIRKTLDLIRRMDNKPIDFLMNMQDSDLEVFSDFRHRTFSGQDCMFFIRSLQHIYKHGKGLYHCFLEGYSKRNNVQDAILYFRKIFFEIEHPERSRKHIADPSRGSAAKRINLFLRWMVRRDQVDPGGWEGVSPSKLVVPLDTHMHGISLTLGLTRRKQADMRTALEITEAFRTIAPEDPVRYDFALTRPGIRGGRDVELVDERVS